MKTHIVMVDLSESEYFIDRLGKLQSNSTILAGFGNILVEITAIDSNWTKIQ